MTTVAKITKNLSKTASQLEAHAERMTDRALQDADLIDVVILRFNEKFYWLLNTTQSIIDAVEGFADRRLQALEDKLDARIEKLEDRIAEAHAEAEKARAVSAKINGLIS